jgi:signal transduction histidine kinase
MKKGILINYLCFVFVTYLLILSSVIKATQYSDPQKIFKEAIIQYANGLETHNRYKIANAQLEIGTFYYYQGEYNTAESYCWKAGINFQVVGDPIGLTKSLIVLGDVMRKEKNFEKAMEFYLAAKYLATFKNASSEKSRIINKIGDIFRHKKQLKKAEEYYEQSIEINKRNHSMIDLANDYANIGEVKRLQGNYEFAKVYYQQGLEIANVYKLPFNFVENGIGLVCLDTIKKDFESALLQLNLIKSIAEKHKFREELKHIYLLESAIYESKGNYKKATQTFKSYNDLIERIYSTSTTQQSLQQNELFKLDLKNDELKKKNHAIRQMSLMQSWLFVAIFLLLIAGIYFYFISTQRKKEHKELKTQATLLQRINEEIKIQKSELNISNETRNKMLGMITHDVRSPLYDCMRLMEVMLNKTIKNEEFNDMGKQIISSLRVSTQLIDNLMFWARSNSNNLNAQLEIIDIAITLEEEINFLKIIADGRLINFNVSIPENTMVYADPNMLRMIVRNLVMNALKYTPKHGEIKLIANRINGHTEIKVIDNGKGIANEQIEHLFDYKNKKSLRGLQGENGSGLGLILVKEFVEKNKGNITVNSKLNLGSEFRFTLNSI